MESPTNCHISRVQLTSDGHKPYLEAIEGAFGGDIDYAILVKTYGAAPEGQRRYSPAVCTGARKFRVEGKILTAAQIIDNRRPQVPFGFTEGFKKAGREETGQDRLL